MTLSIEKLHYFLDVNHYTPQKYFMYKNKCRFIEVLSLKYATSFLLVVSSFNFHIPPGDNVFEMAKLPTLHLSDDVSDYIHISEHTIEKSYNTVDANVDMPESHHRPMSDHLSDLYKHEVIVEDVKQAESIVLKNMARQLNRLKYCVHGLQHRVGILHSSFLGVREDEKLVLYQILNTTPRKTPVLYVVVDFSIFYDKVKVVAHEINQLYQGIYSILNHNQDKHTRNLQHIIENKHNVLKNAGKLQTTKKKYVEYIKQYNEVLQKLYRYEETLLEELDRYKVPQDNDVRQDMKRVQQKQAIEKKLNKVRQTKKTLIDTLSELHEKNQNLTLTIDNVLFNNIVMMDKMFKNFELLDQLS